MKTYEVIYKADGIKKRRTFLTETEMFKFEQLCVNNNWVIVYAGTL